jgi:hypothetical protein
VQSDKLSFQHFVQRSAGILGDEVYFAMHTKRRSAHQRLSSSRKSVNLLGEWDLNRARSKYVLLAQPLQSSSFPK